ncbi:MAG: DUF1080 domain-containing protein [Planctomycetes bacterium]|nr:DUF1080 domain-containing protein [Planctomycetota bacterium]
MCARVLLTVSLTLTIYVSAMAEEKAKLNAPPKGFTALFNGKDLTGWEVNKRNAGHWTVADGVLHYDGKGSSLPTEKDYGDFCVYLDWKIAKGGDSGIYLRGAPQVQIWDINAHKEGSGGLYNNKQNPRKPLTPADNPIGQWNTFKIKLVGDKVTVHLNGKLVVDETTMDTLKGRKTGRILLQHHGNTLWFRNIYIKEVKAAKSGE